MGKRQGSMGRQTRLQGQQPGPSQPPPSPLPCSSVPGSHRCLPYVPLRRTAPALLHLARPRCHLRAPPPRTYPALPHTHEQLRP